MNDEEFKLAPERNPKSRPTSPYPGSDSNSRLADLRRQRGTIKGRLTLFEKYITKLEFEKLNSNQEVELKMRIQSTEDIFKNFNDIQSEIESICDESGVLEQLEYREKFESLYYAVVSKAKCLADQNKQICNNNLGKFNNVAIKLPEIKLPAFDGSYDQWLEYRNSYINMIHDNKNLDAIQKFHYLRSSLSGSALQVISALEFTIDNYIHAWELLEARFHNNRLLVHNHVKSLFCAPSINKESPAQIRKLIDTVLRNLRALKSLKEPTDNWDTLIIYLVASKFDYMTEQEWEKHKGTLLSELQDRSLKLDHLLTFLRNRADMLEMMKSNNSKPSHSHPEFKYNSRPTNDYTKRSQSQQSHSQSYSYVATNNKTISTNNSLHKNNNTPNRLCLLCGGSHYIYSCYTFLNYSIQDRLKFVIDKKLCKNCIRTHNHMPNECSFGPCKVCQKKHNTLLHTDTRNNASLQFVASASTSPSSSEDKQGKCDTSLSYAGIIGTKSCASGTVEETKVLTPVLLSTALIEVIDSYNNYHTVRALLDNGSQHSFITERLCKRLNIPMIQSTIRISGVGQLVTQSTHSCKLKLRSKVSNYCTQLNCLVLSNIASNLQSIDYNNIRIPQDIQLADPKYDVSSEIDVLIGADIFWELLSVGRFRLKSGPYLQDSKLGWIISGPIFNNKQSYKIEHTHCSLVQLDNQLRKFWELEEISNTSRIMSNEEQFCETLFVNTTERDKNGRFCVRMPLNETTDLLGDSFLTAKKRFLSLEKKLDSSVGFKQLYCDFMRKYEKSGHMTAVTDNINNIKKPYYILPHHGVYRESSTTTKLRVVFDGSAATTSGKSINDIQHVGPPLQNEIFSILIRLRQYRYVACADIEAFFRQILIHSDQRNLQLILWRESHDLPMMIYRLNTVTYGTASAPYLSMRCLRQLAQECNDDVIAKVIKEDFYVDDLIFGHNELDTLIEICNKVSKTLEGGCFPLRKWTFNREMDSELTKDLSIGEHCQSSTLGLGWANISDEFYFTSKLTEHNTGSKKLTKRIIMSVISQIYDPLGLLASAIIKAKVLLQQLWLCKIDWDDEVSADIASSWKLFISELEFLKDIRISRHVIGVNTQKTELHIFTDASQCAYGSCAYIRSYNEDSSFVNVQLLCAKSKVSPIKTISIPRLELCGALVGAKLYAKIVSSMRLQFDKVYFWTDSTIVQGWLRMSPHLLKTFVQNRVMQINELTGDKIWRHVKGKDNPADLVSRGVDLKFLKSGENNNKHLWWSGPYFLHGSNEQLLNYTENNPVCTDLPELKPQVASLFISSSPELLLNFEKFSSFNRLKRMGAYLLRFVNNIRASISVSGNGGRLRKTGPLSADELDSSVQMLTRIVQRQLFPDECDYLLNKLPLNNLKNKNQINKFSGLNVFMDHNNVIRVGGRLCNANEFNYNKKHPVLLSSKHRFAWLICNHEHKRLLHAGPQLLVSTMREEWWILGARNLARQVVHKCMVCARMRGQTVAPIMGNLPAERLESGFPFIYCGVDYAGPLLVLNRKGRGAQLIKCYICLFVCFATRAVHLELVSSLTSQDYILALHRFISRRGKPHQIFSDNGKTFIGAERELSVIFKDSEAILNFAANNNIRFSFIPPYAPHFGGLWEAGVKSCKHHLRRVLGNAKLTYEEFTTLLTQIEAVLNSRPLSPLSSDPNDYLPLTPAHFMIGRPLTAPATKDFSRMDYMRLSRYDRVEQLRQHFWTRWSKEYVSELQLRTKWKNDGEDITQDTLVLIKEDNLPPLKWRMGRIIRVMPGKDGVNRVAEIRTATGVIQRAFSKICPLPVTPLAEDVATL